MTPARGRRPAVRPAPRRGFGRTWWGRAWIEALEQRARLDPNRLPRGRTYARKGRVGPVDVQPGDIRASVQGSRVTPYVVHVRVRAFDDAEWDRLLDAIAAKAAHTAALLDGELPPEVVADAEAAGVELLPVAGEIGPRCSCPDWADPCKHAAAVVYLMADVLDEDPFALLLLRGRTRAEVLAALRHRRSPAGARPSVGPTDGGRRVDAGLEARVVWARAAEPAGLPRLPAVPLPPRRPGDPAPLALDPPASSGIRRVDLAALAADAAERAWALCVGEGDGGLTLDEDLDLARRAARLLRSPTRRGLGEMAAHAGVPASDLLRRADAWRLGGPDAIAVVEESWSPAAEQLEEGRGALAPYGDVRVWRNRLTVGGAGLQLRVSGGGAWYRFDRSGERWELAAGPEADPSRALPVATATPGRDRA